MDYLKILISVAGGSLISATAIALSAEYIISLVESGIISGIFGAGIVIVVVIAVFLWAKRRMGNSKTAEKKKNTE
jgi:uncharacterized membrane protein YciS (DUF1049 family)